MSEPDYEAGFALGDTAAAAPDPSRVYDSLVLGAGPAGIAAAIYLVRKGLSTALIADTLGGQVSWTAGIENYPGFRLIEGPQLVAKLNEHLAEAAPDIALHTEVSAVERSGALFAARAGANVYRARTLIAATGKRPRLLGVPGERRLIGRGVSTCSICDAPLFRGKTVAVVGGGNSGLAAALDLATAAARVVLIQDLDRLSGDAVLERRVRAQPKIELLLGTAATAVLGDDRVSGVRVRPTGGGPENVVEVAGVFVEIGLTPNSEPFRGLAPLNERGEIPVDCACRTAVPGLFAAGDVTDVPFKQVVIAAGEGAKAALSAADYLLRDEEER